MLVEKLENDNKAYILFYLSFAKCLYSLSIPHGFLYESRVVVNMT